MCSASEQFGHITRLCFSEAVGTALLTLMSCMGTADPNAPLVERALAVGFTVSAVIHGFGHISGAHVNPSVTIAAVISGALPFSLAPYYIGSQCIGAVLGSLIFPQFSAVALPSTACVCLPHPDISVLQAVMIEMTTTSMLILACCASWDSRNSKNTDSNPVKFGVLVAMVKLTTMNLTGASMNPAAALGPVVWNNYWDYHWVYWLGPCAGAVLTSSLYRIIYSIPTREDNIMFK